MGCGEVRQRWKGSQEKFHHRASSTVDTQSVIPPRLSGAREDSPAASQGPFPTQWVTANSWWALMGFGSQTEPLGLASQGSLAVGVGLAITAMVNAEGIWPGHWGHLQQAPSQEPSWK